MSEEKLSREGGSPSQQSRVNFCDVFMWEKNDLFATAMPLTTAFSRKLWMGSMCKDVLSDTLQPEVHSEAFFLFICLDANKFVLLSFVSLMKTIHPRVSTKPLPNDAKSPNPVDVCRSKTLSWPGQSVCMEKSWPGRSQTLPWKKGEPSTESTFCFLCKSPSFERKCNMKSWLARVVRVEEWPFYPEVSSIWTGP